MRFVPHTEPNQVDARLVINQIAQATLRLQLGEYPEDAMIELGDLFRSLGHLQIPRVVEISWSAHNLVSAVQEQTLETSAAVIESLRLASSYISYLYNGLERGLDPKTDVLDELLERMDLLSSGSPIHNVDQRVTEEQILPPSEFSALSFPIAPRKDHEPAVEVRLCNRLFADLTLLRHILNESESELKTLRSSCVSIAQDLTYVLQVVGNLSNSHKESLEALSIAVEAALRKYHRQFKSHLSFPLDHNTSSHLNSLYSSTFRRLVPALQKLVHTLSSQCSTSDASCEVDYIVNDHDLKIELRYPMFVFDRDELTAALASWEGLRENSNALQAERMIEFLLDPMHSALSPIGDALSEFQSTLRELGGQVQVHCGADETLKVITLLPQYVRPLLLLPVISNGDLLALDCDTIKAIVPACAVPYDRVQNSVRYKNESYEYMQYARARRPLAPHPRDWGLIVFIRASNKLVALRVDVVQDLIEHAIRPSRARCWRGHTAIMTDDIAMLMDPEYLDVGPAATRERDWNFKRKRFLIANAPVEGYAQLEQTIVSLGCSTAATSDLRQTIQQVQEFKPDFLIIPFGLYGRHEEFARRIIESTSLMREQVLVVRTEQVTDPLVYYIHDGRGDADTEGLEILVGTNLVEQIEYLVNEVSLENA